MTSDKESFPIQRLSVVNTGRRRRWSRAEKLRIVAESYEGDRQASATARRYDLSPSLLFTWRKAYAQAARRADEEPGFASAVIVPNAAPPADGTMAGRMQVVTVTGQRINVGADVDVGVLARLVAALEGRPGYVGPKPGFGDGS